VGRERRDTGHTARSCFVWLRVSTKSGLAPTNFISLAGHNLAGSWKTGFRPNVSSPLSSHLVHASNDALLEAEARISTIQMNLIQQGRL
jgi:hypothetical protein